MARNFLSSVARGFIRSAVNQVGRDSGRVVSNAMYGDAHAVPVRNAGGGGGGVPYIEIAEGTNKVLAVDRPDLSVGTFGYVFYAFLGFCFVFIGPVLFLVNGVKRLRRTEITAKRCVARNDETTGGPCVYTEKVSLPKTESECLTDRRVGTVYVILGIVSLLFSFILLVSPYVSGGTGTPAAVRL